MYGIRWTESGKNMKKEIMCGWKHTVRCTKIIQSRMSKGIGRKNVQNRIYTSAINITKIQVIKPMHRTMLSITWHKNNATSDIDTRNKYINTTHVHSTTPAHTQARATTHNDTARE